jgi:BASS family bile acid:Na+ symporter
MSLAELVPLVLKASIMTIVFSLGLTALPRDLVYLVSHPGRLTLSLASMFVVMLIAAGGMSRLLDLPRPVEILVVALALAPIPPLLPRKTAKAGGDASYTVGLLVAASLFSIVWIPFALWLLRTVFEAPLQASTGDLLNTVLLSILAPLAAGALLARFTPKFASWVQPAFARLGNLLLLAAIVPILFKTWHPALLQIGGGTLLALAAFVVVGLITGQLMGGPDPDDRTVLAFATSTRHPGIAMSLAALNFPQEKTVVAVLLLYLIVAAVLTIPYMMWRKRVGAAQLKPA